MMKTNEFAFATALAAGVFLAGCAPEAPDAAASCVTGETYAGIVTKLGFARAVSADVAPGFDIDGRVSDTSDYTSCGKKDFVDEEGRQGIDNQLAPLVPEVEKLVGNAVDGLIQGSINDGQLVILYEMENVDDLVNDECVNFAVQVGTKKRPNLGTDGVIEGYQTFELDPTAERSYVTGARIENGVLSAGPFVVSIPLAIFDVAFTLHVKDARFRFSIGEDGVMHGYLGGGIMPPELLEGISDGDGLEDLLPQINVALEANTDLAYDDDTGKCHELSSALEFSGAPSFIRR
jgi:hypothetical protein